MPSSTDRQWTTHVEKEDDFGEDVIQHVLANNSASITSPPGTGKSHLLCLVRDRFQAAGVNTQVLAPTNAAARIAGGTTVHAFLSKMSNSRHGF
jgi:reverse gyrase